MRTVGQIIDSVLLAGIIVLLARFVLDWVQMFARHWRPKGAVLILCEVIYSLTDPPLRWLRRFVPPLRIGGAAIDLSPMILLIGIYILQKINFAIFFR